MTDTPLPFENITKPTKLIKAAQKFFWENVERETDECILWPYTVSPSGYGQMHYIDRLVPTHKLALAYRVSPPMADKGMALHRPILCHNRACFNYRHLYWGDRVQNMKDMIADGTSNRGTRNGSAKLSVEDVLAIRADTRSSYILGKEYGVRSNHIRDIKTGKRWGWLQAPTKEQI